MLGGFLVDLSRQILVSNSLSGPNSYLRGFLVALSRKILVSNSPFGPNLGMVLLHCLDMDTSQSVRFSLGGGICKD